LGEVAVEGKSNEITAIPELLKLLDPKGALVTIDAIGCQKALAQQIVDKGGNYLLAVKANQEHLLADSLAKGANTDPKGENADSLAKGANADRPPLAKGENVCPPPLAKGGVGGVFLLNVAQATFFVTWRATPP
jgi:hypothetical protein